MDFNTGMLKRNIFDTNNAILVVSIVDLAHFHRWQVNGGDYRNDKDYNNNDDDNDNDRKASHY